MPTGAALTISGLTNRFHTGAQEIIAADDLIVEVAGGSCTAITGPSGSGKSTLLHLIGAIEAPHNGTIVVEESRRRRCGASS
ncbi:hypothetical protein GCM10009827_071990 [Dactylosporangium maewongense]|uniref:ABC transporter domain-containing protein n=1 Tax=Dactylosporangium maewongense TaxID=634393 RepID=A0ABN2BLW8_9ACTN